MNFGGPRSARRGPQQLDGSHKPCSCRRHTFAAVSSCNRREQRLGKGTVRSRSAEESNPRRAHITRKPSVENAGRVCPLSAHAWFEVTMSQWARAFLSRRLFVRRDAFLPIQRSLELHRPSTATSWRPRAASSALNAALVISSTPHSSRSISDRFDSRRQTRRLRRSEFSTSQAPGAGFSLESIECMFV